MTSLLALSRKRFAFVAGNDGGSSGCWRALEPQRGI